jgi:hypothetical protein
MGTMNFFLDDLSGSDTALFPLREAGFPGASVSSAVAIIFPVFLIV